MAVLFHQMPHLLRHQFCQLFFLGLLITLLGGCKLSAPDSGENSGTNQITLSMSSPNQLDADSFPNTDVVTISVLLVNGAGDPIPGVLVTLASSLGTLTATTALTNNDGRATVTINPSAILGAGRVTATYGTLSKTYNFELMSQSPGTTIDTPQISLSLLRNGLAINRFKSDESVQLQATVTDADNIPVSNQIVTFTIELGTLDVATALTNVNGIAQVNLLASDDTLGAAAALASVTIDGTTIVSRLNYEIINSTTNVTDEVIKLGSFNSSNEFVENVLGSSIAPDVDGDINISAGGTLGISLAIVDENNQRILTPSQVNFTSSCVASERATIGTNVFTVNGVATTTYEDLLCGGGQDVILATVTVNNQTTTLSQTINISPENIGSIVFISSSPESIVLKGTGGQGQQETSTLTFLVKGTLGNPLAQQPVSFSLNTSVGNLTLTPATSLTNSLGLVTTKVNAGNVPTAVRVTASVTAANNQVIQTQSDLLSVNTGMPDQDSFTLGAVTYNPEADQYNGVEVEVNARLADSFNNPVPDGTTINFTTEGGNITPSCNTVGGMCTAIWTSSEPRVANHRITILATAVGHETFFDVNGNNTFDDGDGLGFDDTAVSGLGRIIPAANGFFDMSEAWRDDNENYVYDSGEKFLDFNNNETFDARDVLFNGPQCQGSRCATGGNRSLHVRKAIVMGMSGSDARLTLMSGSQSDVLNSGITHINGSRVYASNDRVRSDSNQVVRDLTPLVISEDGTERFRLTFADFGLPYGQILPLGTSIQVTANGGLLKGTSNYTVLNGVGSNDPNVYNGQDIDFLIENTNTLATPGETSINGEMIITATTPKGVITQLFFYYTLAGS